VRYWKSILIALLAPPHIFIGMMAHRFPWWVTALALAAELFILGIGIAAGAICIISAIGSGASHDLT